MLHRKSFFLSLAGYIFVLCPVLADEAKPATRLSTSFNSGEFKKQQSIVIVKTTAAIELRPTVVTLYSQRADARFFLGEFKLAVVDYKKMVELNPKLDASHWRLGIAYFFTGQYKLAARQFEIYHSYDNVDRENGIWRFYSQLKAYGPDRAREGLLKYKKDDRAPFPLIYQLFSGDITGPEILDEINKAKIAADEREKQLFYAHLYIGLNAAYSGDSKLAIQQLQQSVSNRWGPKAGYGPHYMWQVGRLQLELLQKMNTGSQTNPKEAEQVPPVDE